MIAPRDHPADQRHEDNEQKDRPGGARPMLLHNPVAADNGLRTTGGLAAFVLATGRLVGLDRSSQELVESNRQTPSKSSALSPEEGGEAMGIEVLSPG